MRAIGSACSGRSPATTTRWCCGTRRIYILPTRRGLAVFGMLALMLLTSLNYSLSLGFLVTFLLAGLYSAALLHTFRNLAGIELSPLAAGETFAGGTLPFTLALAGSPVSRRGITLAAGGSVHVTVDVTPGCGAAGDARDSGTPAWPGRARTRDPVVGFSGRALARLGVRALPAERRRLSGAGGRCAAAPAGARRRGRA